MLVDLHRSIYKLFNDGDLEGLISHTHDDIEIYDFTTNKLILKGIDQFRANNVPYIEEGKIKFQLEQIMEVAPNIVLGYMTFTGYEGKRVAVYEYEGDKIRRSWMVQYIEQEEKQE